jgi:TolA-binding protein
MESQDVADTFLVKWWPQIEANKNRIGIGAAIIVGAVLLYSIISWRHEQNQIAAGEAFTQALISLPPNSNPSQMADAYLAIAADHPNTPAGGRSLLQGALALFEEGKYTDARGYFQQFLDEHPDDEFSGQAALGVAKCYEAEGKLNEASGAYQHVINDLSDANAKVAAEFSLAQLDLQARNYADAVRLFQEVAQQAPYSTVASEAQQYLFQLRSSSAPAAAPAATPAAQPTTTAPAPAPAPSFQLTH